MTTSRQSAQQRRRDRERRHRLEVTNRPTNRELAQRARRNREQSFNLQQLPIARRPLSAQPAGTLSLRHRLSRCDVVCSFCRADHWIEEKIQESSKSAPRFSMCCGAGVIAMDRFEPPPEPLYSLLMQVTPGICPCHIFADNH
jgi:hypothetical protein